MRLARSARLLLPLAVISGLLHLPAIAGDWPEREDVDAVVEPLIGKDTPGLGVLVMKNGKVLHLKGYGEANIETGAPVTPDTLFDLASVSKEMTAMAAMLQIEDGLYEPETEISTILPAFADRPGDERALTVSDLVHHVAGLTDYLDGNEALDYQDETTNQEVIAWLARQKPVRPPGVKYEYSNSAYLTLGSLVAAADEEKSLDSVLYNRIFQPLGMTSTGLITSKRVKLSRRARGYVGTGGDFELNEENTVTEGDGNVFTSLADLARYEQALATNGLLSEEATAKLFENGTYDDGSPIEVDGEGYGYGWSLAEGKQRYASHSGSWMGTSTYYQRNLTTGVTVILLANGEDMSNGDLAVDIESAISNE